MSTCLELGIVGDVPGLSSESDVASVVPGAQCQPAGLPRGSELGHSGLRCHRSHQAEWGSGPWGRFDRWGGA